MIARPQTHQQTGICSWLCVTMLLLLASSDAQAEKIYHLNNYPAQQDGGTLSGSITVVDSAADDGLLMAGEIISWVFTLTDAGGENTETIDSTTTPNPELSLFGEIAITASEILLATPEPDGFNSIGFGELPVSIHDARIVWSRNDDSFVGPYDNYFADDLQATSPSGDDVNYWSTGGPNFSLGGTDPWVIATAHVEVSQDINAVLKAVLKKKLKRLSKASKKAKRKKKASKAKRLKRKVRKLKRQLRAL